MNPNGRLRSFGICSKEFRINTCLTVFVHNNKDQIIMANSDSINSHGNAEYVGKNDGSINTDKDETKQQQENKMKTDEINLTVDQEDEQESNRRYLNFTFK